MKGKSRYSNMYKSEQEKKIILENKGRRKIDSTILLNDVRDVIQKFGGDTSIATYRENGTFSSSTVLRHFDGSWNRVLSAVGIKVKSKARRREIRDEEIEWKKRKCLGIDCDITFLSWGPENRLCSACRTSDFFLEPSGDIFHVNFTQKGKGKGKDIDSY